MEVLEHDIRALAATKLKTPRVYRLKVSSMQEEAARQIWLGRCLSVNVEADKELP